MGQMIQFESFNEREMILRLEFSQGVHSYREQPVRLFYSDGDRMRTYFPDFEARLTNGDVIHIEVKPVERLSSMVTTEKFSHIAEHYARYRTELYRIITDEELRVEPLSTNLKLLSTIKTKPSDQRVIAPNLKQSGEKWADLAIKHGAQALYRHVAHGEWVCALDQPLEGDLLVFHRNGVKNDPIYF